MKKYLDSWCFNTVVAIVAALLALCAEYDGRFWSCLPLVVLVSVFASLASEFVKIFINGGVFSWRDLLIGAGAAVAVVSAVLGLIG